MPVEATVMGTSIHRRALIPLVNIDQILAEWQNTANPTLPYWSAFSTNWLSACGDTKIRGGVIEGRAEPREKLTARSHDQADVRPLGSSRG
jgi:hypothetical protein